MVVLYISRKKVLPLLLTFMVIAISIIYSQSFGNNAIGVFFSTKKELPIYSVETQSKRISISFDAAWGAEYTDQILEILDQRNIKTTFFLVGMWVDRYPDKVRKIAQEGHEIGNHSTNHPHMTRLSKEQMKTEIETTQNKIEQLAGDRTVKLFRPPFGDYNDTLIKLCREIEYYPIQWDVDSLDWKNLGADHMYNRVTSKVRNGSIVLFHNNADYIVQALPRILDRLLEEGYEIIPISELIYKENYYMDHTGRQKKQNIDGINQ